MEGNQKEAVSTQKTLQANHDPGWNDPPSWAFTSSQKSTIGTPTKRLLNKRVAFPLNSNSSTSNIVNQNIPPGNIPPPTEISSLTTAPHKPIILPTGMKIENFNSDININKEEVLKDTLDNLRFVMDQIESNKAEEIQKRLDRMEAMYNESKLNNNVHRILLEISRALKENDLEKADQLHIALMMNNASVCSSWIPGIRQLITEMKNKNM